ncbi:adenine deaminase [Pseudalkalibacillus caeni]|uniref:Adenine deaminase n=1 Tax=Exobacillus caeni TaxID=2574798 RepID=A0A5R9FH88_9BACL|nr:adenine deaminase [Pseudalkalibacillus caeni]TLS38925.1 adenine deaminase [Pseudalkalibacillus caeni]
MEHTKEKLKRRIDVAAKRTPADLVIKNSKIVNVFTLEIIEEDVAVVDGYIAGIGNYEGIMTVDAEGKYLTPGFIDGHVHIESAMVTPSEFSNVVIPHGVTTVVADPHEIGNVCGIEGIKFMIDSSNNIPLDVFFMLPSCVPATPFENAGAKLEFEHLEPLYLLPRVIGLGEVMDFPAVFHNHENMLAKLSSAIVKSKCIDGHAAGVNSDGINVYMAAGIRTDHECVNAEEALDRLRKGMHVMLREGSAARDLKALLKAINRENARRCLFVTDDKHLDDLIEEGSIDHNIRMAIKEGIDPLLAVQIATLNAAECFGFKNKGAIAPGYEADFLLISDLENVTIESVYKSGVLVAKNSKMVSPSEQSLIPSAPILDSIKAKQISVKDLQIRLDNKTEANIIGIIPNSIVTKHLIEKVTVMDGLFTSCTEKDHLKLAVLERHKSTGNIGLGIIKGLGLKKGAIASTVAHDSHNIVAAGTCDEDLLTAIRVTSQMKGGLAVVLEGETLAALSLPIAGLMSDMDSHLIYARLKELNKALAEIGCSHEFNPFLTLSFLALPVIPELKLTDIGLFNVKTFQHIAVEYFQT